MVTGKATSALGKPGFSAGERHGYKMFTWGINQAPDCRLETLTSVLSLLSILVCITCQIVCYPQTQS